MRLVLRRATPLGGILFGVVIGQVILWFVGWYGLVVLGVLASILSVLHIRWPGILGGVLIAAATSFSFSFSNAPIPALTDAAFPIKVDAPPRYPKVGLIKFTGVLLDRPWVGKRVVVSAVHLPWHNSVYVEEGDTIWFRGDCAPPELTINPFTYAAWLIRQGISAQCKADFLSRSQKKEKPVRSSLQDAITGKTYSVAGENEGAGLFLAMAFGFRDQLSDITERSFKNLGLTHLLVVSGYQISLIFGVILNVSAWILMSSRLVLCPRNTAVYPAILSAGFYVWVCGSDTATVRALLAGICVALQIWLEHPISFLHRIFLAVLGLNFLFPFALFDLGVQFTVAALLGIASGSYISRRKRRIRAYFAVSVHVWLFTSLLTVLWFGRMPLASLPINLLLAAPWATFNCIFGAIGLFLTYIPIPYLEFPLALTAIVNQYLLEHVRHLSGYGELFTVLCDGVWARASVSMVIALIVTILWWPDIRELVVSRGRSACL